MAKYKKFKKESYLDNKNSTPKKQSAQLSIKIDSQLNKALLQLSDDLNISRNRLIEYLLSRSGLIEEVDENYY